MTAEATLYLVEPEPEAPAEMDTATDAAHASISEEITSARRDLLELVLNDQEAWELFDRQCGEGIAYIVERARQLQNMIEERGRYHEKGAVEVAIPELAAEVHPDSPAAAWEWLLERTRCDEITFGNPITAVQMLATLDHRYFTRMMRVAYDSDGPNEDELLALARDVWTDLRRRGHRHEPRGFMGHVWLAVRTLFPAASGVQLTPEWASSIYRRVYDDLSCHARGVDADTVDLTAFDKAVEEMHTAERTGDRRMFLGAARYAVAAGRRVSRDAAYATDQVN